METKQELRTKLRQLSKAIQPTEREQWSVQLTEQIVQHPHWQRAQHIGLYMALEDEPDLDLLLRETSGKHFYLPRVLDEERMCFLPYTGVQDLESSIHFSLREPKLSEQAAVDPALLDLILVPALAYDSQGYRLGRGKGYYDRYLAHCCSAYRLGLSFGLVRPQQLPHDPWDLAMHEVLYP